MTGLNRGYRRRSTNLVGSMWDWCPSATQSERWLSGEIVMDPDQASPETQRWLFYPEGLTFDIRGPVL